MVTLIWAESRDHKIGDGESMPWHLPGEFKHFKKATFGGTIVMGRGTWESIGSRPLPNRTNIVISKSLDQAPGAEIISNINEIPLKENTFIIGGLSIYRQTMVIADRLLVTVVDMEAGAEFNISAPEIDPELFLLTNTGDKQYGDFYPWSVKTYYRCGRV